MRVLLINQFFIPDVAPTGVYLADLARHLTSLGHHVTVVCSKNHYQATDADVAPPHGIQVVRVPALTFKRNVISRLLSYGSFFFGALKHCLLGPRPDLVVSMTTPPLLSIAGSLSKALRGTRHFIWEMDIFPDALVTTGALTPNALVFKVLKRIQTAIHRHADGIVVLGPCMRERLLAAGAPSNIIHVAENWADSTTITPTEASITGPLHVLYSGNLGLAHDVDTIIAAFRYFKNDPRFVFSFAGGGSGRQTLKQLCEAEGIDNVHFLPYADRQHMSSHLAQGHVGLVTQLTECLGIIVPSKVYGLMAAARPVLFIGPHNATPSLLIERFGCGWQIEPGSSNDLVSLLLRLELRRDEVMERGRNALDAFVHHYDLPHGVARVTAALGLNEPVQPLDQASAAETMLQQSF